MDYLKDVLIKTVVFPNENVVPDNIHEYFDLIDINYARSLAILIFNMNIQDANQLILDTHKCIYLTERLFFTGNRYTIMVFVTESKQFKIIRLYKRVLNIKYIKNSGSCGNTSECSISSLNNDGYEVSKEEIHFNGTFSHVVDTVQELYNYCTYIRTLLVCRLCVFGPLEYIVRSIVQNIYISLDDNTYDTGLIFDTVKCVCLFTELYELMTKGVILLNRTQLENIKTLYHFYMLEIVIE